MTPLLLRCPPLENKLIGNILREYPQMSEVMKRRFGGHCLERRGFKIQTLGMACILSGVDQKQLLHELETPEQEGPEGQYPIVYIKPNKSQENDEE